MSEIEETEQYAMTQAADLNPFLCEECQIWNDSPRLIRHYHERGILQQPMTGPMLEARIHNQSNVLELETSDLGCLVCNAVFAAARARMACSRERDRRHAPCTGTGQILIGSEGQYY